MSPFPKISIILPLYIITDRFYKDFYGFDYIDYPDYEVLVVCDTAIQLPKLRKHTVKFISTHRVATGPAEKRDIALHYAKGKICAFIDDDAYPDHAWLKNAVSWFENKNVVGVGGPGVTPHEDTFWEKIGGYIVESYLCSGGVQYRYHPTRLGFVDDYPAYNLLVRTDILRKVGGYNCNFYGGEDTFLCLKLVQNGHIIYDPSVLVYHHRRAFPYAHLKQIANVGLHRGYFFKKFPETSRRMFYLLPTFLTFSFICFMILGFALKGIVLWVVLTMLLFFWALGSVSVFRHKYGILESIISGLGIVFTHIVYGFAFVYGLTIRDLKR